MEQAPNDNCSPIPFDDAIIGIPHPEAAADLAETTPGSPQHTWFLPVTHCALVTYLDAVRSMGKLMDAYWYLWDPECTLRFVTAWNDGTLRIGFEATSAYPGTARRLLESVRTAAWGTQRALGLGEPTDVCPWPPQGPVHTTFTAEHCLSEFGVFLASPPWRHGSTHQGTWHLVIDILTPAEPTAKTPDTTITFPDPRGADTGPEPQVNPWAMSGALARVTLHGAGPSGEVISALIAADTAADGRLVPRPRGTGDSPPVETIIHPMMLAHLLATPARVGRLLPEHLPTASSDLFTRIDAAPTPHVLLVGASGQGKSTTMAHFGSRALQAGGIVIAVDVHDGDLLRRLHGQAVAAGRPALYIDCSPGPEANPVIRLADPPGGVTPDRHVENLWTMLRHDVWADVPEEQFGAVGEMITRTALSIAVRDPARSFGLSQFPKLIDPKLAGFRADVLARIGDEEVSRAVMGNVMPMVTSKDAGNSAAWIIAKTAPLATPVVRDILEGTSNRVPVEEALTGGWSLFLHAPAGELGEDAARIIIAVFLHRVWAAVRRGVPAQKVTLLLDEWQKYSSQLTGTMLAESRKYNSTRLVLANQHLAQLDYRLRESVLSNTGALGCFRLGPADAALVTGLFPTILTRTLQTLPPHTLALTTFDDDVVTAGPPPLTLPTIDPPPWAQQVEQFWGGAEPQHHPPAPAKAPEPAGQPDPATSLGNLPP